MTFVKLSQDLINQIREKRVSGETIETIAAEKGLSTGVVSKYTRDITKPKKITQAPVRPKKSADSSLAKVTVGDTAQVLGGEFSVETKERADNLTGSRLKAGELRTQKDILQLQNEIREEKDKQQSEANKKTQAERSFAFDPSTGNIRQAMENEKGLTLAESETLLGKWKGDHPNAQTGANQKNQTEAKFAFDASTGTIRQALENEKGLTLAEAEMLQGKWKNDHPNAQNHPQSKEPQVSGFDDNGQPILNPKASYDLKDLSLIDNMRPKPGELEQIVNNEERKLKYKELFGGGEVKKGVIFGMSIEEFAEFRKMVAPGMDPELKAMLQGQQEILKKLVEGGTKTEDPMLAEIKRQNEELKKRLDNEKDERHRNELTRRDEEMGKLQEQVTQLGNRPAAGAKTEIDVLTEIGKDVKGEISGFRQAVFDFAMKYPPPFIKGESKPLPGDIKKIVIDGIKKNGGEDEGTGGSGVIAKPKGPLPPRVQELAEKYFGTSKQK